VDRVARARRADPDEAKVLSTPSFLLPAVPWWEFALRAVLTYVALLVALRLFGKREVGQFTIYDLVFILLVANALQPAMTGPDTSLTGGLILIVALVGTNYLVGRLDRTPRLHHLFTPSPTVIVRNGTYLPDVMRRQGVDQDEIDMAIREHGIKDLKEVQLGVLESDGTISIVPEGSAMQRTKHRVRFNRRN
jgi:uncharacterized membrane protein YcaP (DUF421 family)